MGGQRKCEWTVLKKGPASPVEDGRDRRKKGERSWLSGKEPFECDIEKEGSDRQPSVFIARSINRHFKTRPSTGDSAPGSDPLTGKSQFVLRFAEEISFCSPTGNLTFIEWNRTFRSGVKD
jgi:hypothetical protein